MKTLKFDKTRANNHGLTGIFVRAQKEDGSWDAADMAELTPESLTDWLKRDGGDNALAENCIRAILGYEQVRR